MVTSQYFGTESIKNIFIFYAFLFFLEIIMNKKIIIFDFDWVIIDSFEFHRKKIEKFANIKLDIQTYKDMHNWNFFCSIPEEIKHINWSKYVKYIYKDIILLKIDNKIKDTLIKLNNKYKLHIISSTRSKNIKDFLIKNKIDYIFCEILGWDIHNSKIEKFKMIFEKYNINSEKCVFVTDTLWDILEANKVWVKTFAVDFGYHDRKTLQKANPYKIVSSFDELLKEF